MSSHEGDDNLRKGSTCPDLFVTEPQGPGSPGTVGDTKVYLSRSPVPGYSVSA